MSRASALRQTAYGRLHALSLTTRLVAVVVLMVFSAYLITTALTTMFLRNYLTEQVEGDLRQYITPLGNVAYNQYVRLADQGVVRTGLVPANEYFVLFSPATPTSRPTRSSPPPRSRTDPTCPASAGTTSAWVGTRSPSGPARATGGWCWCSGSRPRTAPWRSRCR